MAASADCQFEIKWPADRPFLIRAGERTRTADPLFTRRVGDRTHQHENAATAGCKRIAAAVTPCSNPIRSALFRGLTGRRRPLPGALPRHPPGGTAGSSPRDPDGIRGVHSERRRPHAPHVRVPTASTNAAELNRPLAVVRRRARIVLSSHRRGVRYAQRRPCRTRRSRKMKVD